MLFVAGFLNLLSSYFIASIAGNFLALYVAFFAFVVLNIEILSLFNGIYGSNILIFSFLNLIFSFLFFKYKKACFLKPIIDFKKIKNAFFLDKSLIVLGIAFLILITISGILAFVMPPLEPDSQTYHFLRAYMFYKNHNLSHFDTNDVRALIMPVNSEIIYCWILALKHKLYNFALLSYFSYFAVITAIWQILSHFRYSIRKKIFAIFLFSSLASTVVSMSCLQTDIVVGALYICAFSLFLKKNNFLSSLSVALALGVKSTAFVILAPYLLIVFIFNRKEFLKYILYLIFNFAIFSSYNYILNFIQYHNPISNNAAYLNHGFWGGLKGYFANLINLSFQFFDFTGFAWGYYLNSKLFALKNMVFNVISINPQIGSNVAQEQINITTDEQIIGFGILGFLAFIPCIFRGLFSKKKVLFLLSISFILNLLILARLMAYMEYSIRFVLSFVCLAAPLFAFAYKKRGFYKFLLCLFCIFYMAILPYHIRRAPAFRILPYLAQNKFNLDKFVDDCYMGKIVRIWMLTPEIKNIIDTKYKNAKKMGYFKSQVSSALYLKEKFDMDFLVASKADEYDLSKYDLIIFEGAVQEDDVFREAEIEYKFDKEKNKIVFLNKGLNCFYTDKRNDLTLNKNTASCRMCFAAYHINKNKNFKLDYNFDFSLPDIPETKIYFYIKND